MNMANNNKMKRHMTHEEEFDMMKMIMDKFLWLGMAIMAFGFYNMITLPGDLGYGLTLLLSGAAVLVIFMAILVREYNFLGRN